MGLGCVASDYPLDNGNNADHEDGGDDDSRQDELQRFSATEIPVAIFAGLHAERGGESAAEHLDGRWPVARCGLFSRVGLFGIF